MTDDTTTKPATQEPATKAAHTQAAHTPGCEHCGKMVESTEGMRAHLKSKHEVK